MSEYEGLYHIAFNAITDALTQIEQVKRQLCAAQQRCEAEYIECGSAVLAEAGSLVEA